MSALELKKIGSVVISSEPDSDLAFKLREVLRKELPVFHDGVLYKGGLTWPNTYSVMVKRCALVVTLMSDPYSRSESCADEFEEATSSGKPVMVSAVARWRGAPQAAPSPPPSSHAQPPSNIALPNHPPPPARWWPRMEAGTPTSSG